MLIHEAFTNWKETFQTEIPADDIPMNSESWNNYTDSLCKDGELTDLQYHYCPAYDDPIPGDADEEREYMLDQMGVTIASDEAPAPTDGTEWDKDASHWTVSLARPHSEPLTVPYHMGPAIEGKPTRDDVLYSLLMDWSGIQAVDTFEEWAEETCSDPDSRQAERIYNQQKKQSACLERLFSDVSMDDLMELFADY